METQMANERKDYSLDDVMNDVYYALDEVHPLTWELGREPTVAEIEQWEDDYEKSYWGEELPEEYWEDNAWLEDGGDEMLD